mmetsp:Transcript_45431/g.73186  ORF Transcript_45431/g.73186 Transcript_45431/m.73186 type:complete len:97 (-) Transcript_45431:76-366(-)
MKSIWVEVQMDMIGSLRLFPSFMADKHKVPHPCIQAQLQVTGHRPRAFSNHRTTLLPKPSNIQKKTVRRMVWCVAVSCGVLQQSLFKTSKYLPAKA